MGYTGLKAIPTKYDGYEFRSKLEAQWAYFFNLLKIPYQYEPQGFDLNGVWYLPDFFLPTLDSFFEVKGKFTDNGGPLKARLLAMASGMKVYVFSDLPSVDQLSKHSAEIAGQAYFPNGDEDYGYFWCITPCCDTKGIEYEGWIHRIDCCLEKRGERFTTSVHGSLMMAFTAARAQRFDGRQ